METGKGGFTRDLKKEAKNYKVPVPARWKDMFAVPTDFKKFLQDIHPNLRYALMSNPLLKGKEVDSIISEVAIYFLEVSKKRGICRYQMYDPIKFPNIPYHKWFLSQLHYFVLSHKKMRDIWNRMKVQFTAQDVDPVTLLATSGEETTWIGNMIFEDFLNMTKNVSDSDAGFKEHAYDLTLSRLSGEPNTVFANRLGVPYSRVVGWTEKLRNLLTDFEVAI